MKRLLTSAALLTTLFAATASAQSRPIELGLTTGYASGFSGEVFVHAPNVAGPIGVKLSAAYTLPSDSIRDDVEVTGLNSALKLGTFGSFKSKGLATESGSHTVLGLDGTYNLGEVTPGVSALGYAGVRYGMFRATERYAKDAALTNNWSMNTFGVGAGAQLSYALAGNVSLVGDLGVDHFFPGTLSNGTKNGTFASGEAGYSDQRARFTFPGTVFKAKIGVKFSNF